MFKRHLRRGLIAVTVVVGLAASPAGATGEINPAGMTVEEFLSHDVEPSLVVSSEVGDPALLAADAGCDAWFTFCARLYAETKVEPTPLQDPGNAGVSWTWYDDDVTARPGFLGFGSTAKTEGYMRSFWYGATDSTQKKATIKDRMTYYGTSVNFGASIPPGVSTEMARVGNSLEFTLSGQGIPGVQPFTDIRHDYRIGATGNFIYQYGHDVFVTWGKLSGAAFSYNVSGTVYI